MPKSIWVRHLRKAREALKKEGGEEDDDDDDADDENGDGHGLAHAEDGRKKYTGIGLRPESGKFVAEIRGTQKRSSLQLQSQLWARPTQQCDCVATMEPLLLRIWDEHACSQHCHKGTFVRLQAES